MAPKGKNLSNKSSNVKNRNRQHPKQAKVKLKRTKVGIALGGIAGIVATLIAYYIGFQDKLVENPLEFNATEESDGGWRIADKETTSIFGSSNCNIERKYADDISVDMFERRYRYKQPLILMFRNGASDWTEPAKWEMKNLKQEYGRWAVKSGNSIEIVRQGGSGDVETSFTQFLDMLISKDSPVGDPFYLFDRNFYKDSSLPGTLRPPEFLKIEADKDASIFLLGASRSGVSFHNHGDGWNGVIFGQKRWFIYLKDTSPPGGIYPGFTQNEWYQKVYPNLTDASKPMECIQYAGELLYLPEGAYHSTLNLGDTVAVAIQKKGFTVETVKLHYQEMDVQGQLHKEKAAAMRRALIKKSRKILEQLVQLLPDNAEMQNRLGMSYVESQQFDIAIPYLKRAIEIDPFFVFAHVNLAQTYAKEHKDDLAEEIFKHAVELSPKLWDCYAAYGDFLMARNRIQEAADLYQKGIEVEPTLRAFWAHLKEAQEKLGDVEGAKKSQEKLNWLTKVGKGAGLQLALNATNHQH